MIVRTFLRERRGLGSLRAAEVLLHQRGYVKVSRGDLSDLEHGRMLPPDEWVKELELVYGAPTGWYPPTVRAVLHGERSCKTCGEPLPASARANRLYHDGCRP